MPGLPYLFGGSSGSFFNRWWFGSTEPGDCNTLRDGSRQSRVAVDRDVDCFTESSVDKMNSTHTCVRGFTLVAERRVPVI